MIKYSWEWSLNSSEEGDLGLKNLTKRSEFQIITISKDNFSYELLKMTQNVFLNLFVCI